MLAQGLIGLLLLGAETGFELPQSTDDRLVVQLVAAEPEVVTPTGIAVDERGRVWVIENHTHFRPDDYEGPEGDRILILDNYDAQGRARRIRTFAEGFQNAMSLGLLPGGGVILVTRSRIYLLRDTTGDDTSDERRVIVDLQTTGDYPHNGLSGFALGPDGNLYFSLGENLGVPYALVGSDGTTLAGGGEGGNIYHCRPDGSGLTHVATGFWNTFDLGFDAFGRLFAVDNDPDSRPPCRLLHVVSGGDYGYRFRNGRRGLHPFTAWNGELPGTLPMVAGTGEAPSGIVAYESDGLPEEYRGELLVTSWGDHVIQRFRLQERGASFSAEAQTMVAGGDDFRPVGIATAPDGSLYVSDWVDRSYPLHRKGRIWRIRRKTARKNTSNPLLLPSKVTEEETDRLAQLLGHRRREIREAAAEELARRSGEGLLRLEQTFTHNDDPRARIHALWAERFLTRKEAVALADLATGDNASELRAAAVEVMARRAGDKYESALLPMTSSHFSPSVRHRALLELRGSKKVERVVPVLADDDPFLFAAAIDVLAQSGRTELLLEVAGDDNPRQRLGALLALRQSGTDEVREALPKFLEDPDPAVRRAAIQWVAEEKLDRFHLLVRSAVAKAPVTRELLEAFLAAGDLFAGGAGAADYERDRYEHLAGLVVDSEQPDSLRALALRLLPTDHPALRVDFLAGLAGAENETLRREAVRILATRGDEASQERLRQSATDLSNPIDLRADAVLGLSHSAKAPATRRLLLALLKDEALSFEALRALRGEARHEEVRRGLARYWTTAKEEADDSSEGRLSEIAAQLALCFSADEANSAGPLSRELHEAADAWVIDPDGQPNIPTKRDNAAQGERVFFHPRGPKCFTCHRVNGRGGEAGPDLSTITRTSDRAKLIESILKPSRQIAPQYVTWTVATGDGRVVSGIILRDGSNEITLADAQGNVTTIPKSEIDQRRPQNTSIMPDDLHRQMTPGELRDLLAFLLTLK